jgi:PTH1 family peptidyl-tRNA hydrolase
MRIIDRFRRKDVEATTASTVLIAGLGNPGKRYAANRHNIGFMIADHYAAEHDWNFGKLQHEAMLALGRIDDLRVIVAKPQTMMNLSGRSVSGLLRFYKVPLDRLLVIYDELDLPFGKLRLREKGGAGGHNGMKSIIEKLGTTDFARMRIGVGRPPGRMHPAAFLLRDFEDSERVELDGLIGDAVRAIETFVREGVSAAMNKHNPRT